MIRNKDFIHTQIYTTGVKLNKQGSNKHFSKFLPGFPNLFSGFCKHTFLSLFWVLSKYIVRKCVKYYKKI